LLDKVAKLKKAKELTNRVSKQTTRKLARVVERQRTKIWKAGRAVPIDKKYERWVMLGVLLTSCFPNLFPVCCLGYGQCVTVRQIKA
jgi:hypothetical protein